MEDFDRTPFKNRDISRLTSNTTTPVATSFRNARDARNGNTPEQRASAAAQKSTKESIEYINRLKTETTKPPRNAGREYEPKVRKRQMKP